MTTTPDTAHNVPIDLRRALRWRWPVLVGAAVAGLLAGSIVAGLRAPQFEATAVAAIVPARPNVIPGADYVSLAAPSFIAYATSPTQLQTVATQAGLDVGELRSSVHAVVQGTSNTITVTVRTDDPKTAALAANLIANDMTEFRDRVTSAVVVATAPTPAAPVTGADDLLRAAGLVGGVAAGLALVWMLERRRPHVAIVPDVAMATEWACLGALPRSSSVRRGNPESSHDPRVEAASRLLVTDVLARLPHGRGVILVTAARHGAGTSTIAEVLAFAAALVGRKVALVPVPEPRPDDAPEEEPTTGELGQLALDTLDRFDIAVIDAPPILEGRWRRDAAGLADCVVLVVSAGDLVDRVRTAAVLGSGLAATHHAAIGNRMSWWPPSAASDETAVESEESLAHPLFGVEGGGATSARD